MNKLSIRVNGKPNRILLSAQIHLVFPFCLSASDCEKVKTFCIQCALMSVHLIYESIWIRITKYAHNWIPKKKNHVNAHILMQIRFFFGLSYIILSLLQHYVVQFPSFRRFTILIVVVVVILMFFYSSKFHDWIGRAMLTHSTLLVWKKKLLRNMLLSAVLSNINIVVFLSFQKKKIHSMQAIYLI